MQDGIDGKQARRTGSSSPLGELFDHGLDSWCTSFFAFGIFSVFSRLDWGLPAWGFYITLWSVYVGFVISHWEKYNTGVLYLPWGYDLSQVAMAAVYAMTAVYGAKLWQNYIFGFQISHVLFVFMNCVTFIITVPVSLYNVYLSYANKTGKMRTFYEAILPLFSSTLAFILFSVWGIFSPGDIMNTQTRMVLFLCSVVFSNIVSRLIVSQMSSCRCQVINNYLYVLLVAMLFCFYVNDAQVELFVVKAMTLCLTLLHIHYGYSVVHQLADHFGIYVFLIKNKKTKTED